MARWITSGDVLKYRNEFLIQGSYETDPTNSSQFTLTSPRRTLLGMTQTALGKAIGVTFQQAQKYERGTNRIGSSRLLALTQVLDVSVNYFFEDMPPEVAAISPGTKKRGKAKKPPSYEPDPMVKRETLELVRAYYKIEDEDVRQQVSLLIKTLGAGGG